MLSGHNITLIVHKTQFHKLASHVVITCKKQTTVVAQHGALCGDSNHLWVLDYADQQN